MPKTLTMTYRRDDYAHRGCLEYSWVPEGKRRVIVLNPGQPSATNTDTVSDELKPSHVQAYVLNNGHVSTAMWQFPPGPPHTSPIVRSSVEVHQPANAIGTVYYADGSHAADSRQLDPYARDCPTSPAPEKS